MDDRINQANQSKVEAAEEKLRQAQLAAQQKKASTKKKGKGDDEADKEVEKQLAKQQAVLRKS